MTTYFGRGLVDKNKSFANTRPYTIFCYICHISNLEMISAQKISIIILYLPLSAIYASYAPVVCLDKNCDHTAEASPTERRKFGFHVTHSDEEKT